VDTVAAVVGAVVVAMVIEVGKVSVLVARMLTPNTWR
jgi:hypothetical protein